MGTLQDKSTYLEGTKTAIKTAIIGKGVAVADADTFRSYAEKINSIDLGPDTSDATATAGDIRTGKTAWVNDVKLTGTFPGVDSSDATATATDILIGQTAYVGNQMVTGTFDGIAVSVVSGLVDGINGEVI